MAKNVEDVHYVMCNGVEHLVVPYTECQTCPSTGERNIFHEVSITTGKRYPLSNCFHKNSSRDKESSHNTSQSLADQVKHLKASKTDDCQTQNFDDCVTAKPDIHELEKIIGKLEMYTSSLKCKLETCKENENNTSKAKTVREEHMLSSGLDSSPTDVNAHSFRHSGNTSVSSDDEITQMSEGNEELLQEKGNMTSTVEAVQERQMVNSALGSRPGYRRANASINSLSTSESSDDEVTQMSKDQEKLVQETPDLIVEQSPVHSSEDSSDSSSLNCDKVVHRPLKSCETNKGNSHACKYGSSLAELNMRSKSDMTSGKTKAKNVYNAKDKFEANKLKKRPLSDSEEQQSVEKQKRSTSKQKASLLSTSKKSAESQNTELSLYETAQETFSQASETLEGYSSGSATP